MLKADLRTIYLAKQHLLSPTERLKKSEQISKRFFYTFGLKDIKTLHLFLPIEKNKEIETRFVYEKVWKDFPDIKTFIPRVDSVTNELETLEFNRQTEIVLSNWQILEPAGNDLFEPNQIDMVLAPLLCFDKKGFRVGYGKGFYDKFFKHCRNDCLKIGLSYFPPIEEISDVNKFDVTLDYCVTPEKIWKF